MKITILMNKKRQDMKTDSKKGKGLYVDVSDSKDALKWSDWATSRLKSEEWGGEGGSSLQKQQTVPR